MKKRTILEKLGDFVLGKGFYIVLFLCVATIGISGYYLIRGIGGGPDASEPVTGNPTVVLPDSEANGPDPAGSLTPDPDLDKDVSGGGDVTDPEQLAETDPDAQSQTEAEEPVREPSGPVVYTWPPPPWGWRCWLCARVPSLRCMTTGSWAPRWSSTTATA